MHQKILDFHFPALLALVIVVAKDKDYSKGQTGPVDLDKREEVVLDLDFGSLVAAVFAGYRIHRVDFHTVVVFLADFHNLEGIVGDFHIQPVLVVDYHQIHLAAEEMGRLKESIHLVCHVDL